MSVNEAYLYTTDVLNKLSSNAGDSLKKHQFVRHYNAAQLQWVEDRVKINETNQVRIDELQPLIVSMEAIPKKENDHWDIDLPEDYYHYSRSYSLSGNCYVYNNPERESDMNIILQDEFHKPSLEWEETPCTLAGNKLRVYADFPINKVYFTYYRVPRKINMKDEFLDVEGNPTEDINPEFDGSSLIEILTLTARNIAGITGDQLQYQINQNRSTQHT